MATSRNWERFTQPRASLYKGLSTSDTTLNCQQTVWADLVSTLASDFMWTLKVGESGSDRSCSGVITWPTNCAGAENLGRRGRFKPTPSSNRSLDSVGFKRCTGGPSSLDKTSCESWVLVKGPFSKTQLSHQCQQDVSSKLLGHPVNIDMVW